MGQKTYQKGGLTKNGSKRTGQKKRVKAMPWVKDRMVDNNNRGGLCNASGPLAVDLPGDEGP